MDSVKLPQHRLEWVDCLRGIAALLVVILHLWLYAIELFHINITGILKLFSHAAFGYTDFGKIGVVVFFLISGYVIPYSLKGKTNKIFFINRFFRLYPAYWVSILSLIFISGLPPLKDLLANLTMFQKFAGIADLNGAFWTLQIEIIFYVICAILHHFRLLENDKFIIKVIMFAIAISIVTAALRFQFDKKLPVALFLALTVMFLGLAWRRYKLDQSIYINKKIIIRLFVFFIGALLPITLMAYAKNYGYNETWYRYFLSYLTAILIFFLFSYYKYVSKTLLYLGSISYSLYLLHGVFGILLTVKVIKYFNVFNVYMYIVAFFFLSILSASLCYFFVEKPLVKLGKRVVNKLSGK